MARIPDAELERLKREVSLARLIEGQGHALISQGQGPGLSMSVHEGDDTPSCIVSPKTNLWHCFGYNAGGSVIDWIMRSHKVSFRHACELLEKQHPAIAGPAAGADEAQQKKLSQGKLRQAQSFSLEAGDQALLDQVIVLSPNLEDQSRGAAIPRQSRLRERGADRALQDRLRQSHACVSTRAGGVQGRRGAALGATAGRILRESGHEHLNGSIIVPLSGPADGTARPVVGADGRKVNQNLRPGTPKHLYLPGPHRGVFNRDGIDGQPEVILCEALIDALTFWAAGYRNVTSC